MNRRSRGNASSLRGPSGVAAALAGAALALAMTACGDRGGSHAEAHETRTPSAQDAPHYDPPVRFAPNGRPLLPTTTATGPRDVSDVVLAGRLAYFQDGDGLQAVDVTTGRSSWSARPGAGATVDGRNIRPALASLGGRQYIIGLFPGELPGHGTTPATPVLELLLVDPATGRTAGDDAMPLPAELAEGFNLHQIVGTDGRAVVIGLSGSSPDAVVVADPAAHRIRWTRQKATPVATSDGLVVVIDAVRPSGFFNIEGTYRLQGIDTATAAVRWSTAPSTADTYQAERAGPRLVTLSGGFDETAGLLDITTGKRRFRYPDQEKLYDCRDDDRSVVVCFTTGRVMALDATTAQLLWELPKDGRTSPSVTAAWHGAVYGTTANGPVVLDARTGRDREASPGAAPALVGPYGGVVKQDRSLVFQAAAG
ncbi:PQQ-binding-like beta-propeller repeat protein [Actinoallomurus liliacearum]|uniref:PQQ-binding-like beta-propeller repeat protein n=1 Tax=Actinoallomurus liliacearum TaxID=1080073 RepID=A0ABP8TVG6_9ACTN